jgi:lipopolysaccharide transport system permease protein
MARIALPSRWFVLLARRRGPLRMYQWIWLVACVAGALAVAAPRILSQPLFYSATAGVQIDAERRYRELYTAGALDDDYRAVEFQTLALLKARHPDLGGPTYGVRFVPGPIGAIQAEALGRTAGEARDLADEAAAALAQQIRAAGGREIMRNLLGWEQVVALEGQPPESSFQATLRQILRTSAFNLNRAVEPVSDHLTVDQLPAEELSDLTRAIEVREEQIARIDLPAAETQRDSAAARGDTALAGQLERDIRRLSDGRQALRRALDELYSRHSAVFDPDAPSDAYRSARATLPAAPVDRRIGLLLALTLASGLAFGGAGVAIDSSAGALRKVNELWSYRALIRNLVLRDLRVRYKSSVLGYLWTQIAPLLTMLVFWFVFSAFFPSSGLAMYPVYLIVGLLAWNFCAEAVTAGARSVLDNAALVKKVFFPREVLPLVSVFSSLVNYLLSLPMLFVVIALVQAYYPPLRASGRLLNISWTVAYLPVLLVIQTLLLAGIALFLSALAVFFRDTVHLIGILVQFWFFLTPVVYSLNVVGETPARVIRWLNPMASLVEFYREILYGNVVPIGAVPTPGLPAVESILRVLLTALAALALGYWFFQRRSGRFGEEL